MTTQSLPGSGSSGTAERPLELAPSSLAIEQMGFPRFVGLVGSMLAIVGFFVIVVSDQYGPRIIPKGWGIMMLALGNLGMLYHAFRDDDVQFRRAYGFYAVILVLFAALLLIFPSTFLAYGWACLLAAICFMTAFSRHETDVTIRLAIQIFEGGLGTIMAVAGLVGGIALQQFMVNYGLILTLAGLVYLTAFTAQAPANDKRSDLASWGIGCLGLFALAYSLIRAIAPTLLGISAGPFLVPTGLFLIAVGTLYLAISAGIVSDNSVVVMTRRELTSYFSSPIAYLVLMGMALIGALNYFFFIAGFEMGRVRMEPIVKDYIGGGIITYILVIFVVPAITMRLFAEERRTGTYEVLMSAPVTELSVVLSKFFAGLIFFVISWIPWWLYLFGLSLESGKSFDYRPLLSFYVALTLSGAAFISMGLFFSSLTNNQIVAAVLTFIGMVSALLFVMLSRMSIGPVWQGLFTKLAFYRVWEASLEGKLLLKDMVLQVSMAVLWLFLTLKVLEARKWN